MLSDDQLYDLRDKIPSNPWITSEEIDEIISQAKLANALKKDAERYRWLKPRYTGVDFEHDDSSEGPTPSIIFEIPANSRWSARLDECIDAAMQAEKEKA